MSTPSERMFDHGGQLIRGSGRDAVAEPHAGGGLMARIRSTSTANRAYALEPTATELSGACSRRRESRSYAISIRRKRRNATTSRIVTTSAAYSVATTMSHAPIDEPSNVIRHTSNGSYVGSTA